MSWRVAKSRIAFGDRDEGIVGDLGCAVVLEQGAVGNVGDLEVCYFSAVHRTATNHQT